MNLEASAGKQPKVNSGRNRMNAAVGWLELPLRQPAELGTNQADAARRRRRVVGSSGQGRRNRSCTDMKIASPVAGEASETMPPGAPKAATASRMASRTEMASIKGGSPTALLP